MKFLFIVDENLRMQWKVIKLTDLLQEIFKLAAAAGMAKLP